MISETDIITLLRNVYHNIYIIRMNRPDRWYFHDLHTETTPYGVLWSSFLGDARAFTTEESVEEFKMLYISPRKTEIIRLTREMML